MRAEPGASRDSQGPIDTWTDGESQSDQRNASQEPFSTHLAGKIVVHDNTRGWKQHQPVRSRHTRMGVGRVGRTDRSDCSGKGLRVTCEHRTSVHLMPGSDSRVYNPRKPLELIMYQETSKRMFLTALVSIATTCQQLKCPSMESRCRNDVIPSKYSQDK